mgnify:CR=1 FL=1
MIALTLAQIADEIGVPVPAGAADVLVSSVEFDTRRIRPGALFVALRGERVDGHDFAAAAAEAGAVAVLGSAPVSAQTLRATRSGQPFRGVRAFIHQASCAVPRVPGRSAI